MSSERWKQITPSQFPFERDALDGVRALLLPLTTFIAHAIRATIAHYQEGT
jgi:hypothetical protein